MSKKPMILTIMDGFGLADEVAGNAVKAAKTPNLDAIFAENPVSRLSASGLDVGLPDGQMGNSEVGHTNMGAGRVVFQNLPRITKAIGDGDFFQNPAYLAAMENCKAKGTTLHIFGLLSDGGVHSHIGHIFALLDMATAQGLEKVCLHAFLDGRDVSPESGLGFVRDAAAHCAQTGATFATVMGRYYAMDRDNRWERVERAYRAMVLGEGVQDADPAHAVAASYEKGVTDEFVEPVVCSDMRIGPDDSVIFANFRPDRAREITRTLVDPEFSGFVRPNGYFPVHYVCTTEYDAAMPNVTVAFPPVALKNTMGEYLSSLGLTQLRIAETEKYAHVTFFFNGGVETVFPGEDRVLIPSPKVATYDLQPQMSAPEVTDAVVERIRSGKYDVIILNFANCDMVGHTGVFEAAVAAVEAVDAGVGRVVEAAKEMGGTVFITADHGNAEQMLQPDGVSPQTAHTTNLVPFCGVGLNGTKLADGRLCDIVPTMLDAMGLEKPAEMEGTSLLRR